MAYKTRQHKAVDWDVVASSDERRLNRNCKGCRHCDQQYLCRYLSDLGPGHSRVKLGVKMYPGGGCDLYTPKSHDKTSIRPGIVLTRETARKMRENIKKPQSGIFDDPDTERIALDLYKKGAGDAQIANTIGASKNTVSEWRKAKGLESNYQKFRKENPV